MNYNNYNPVQNRVDNLLRQKELIDQQIQSLQQMSIPNININNIPNQLPQNIYDFNGKWVDNETQAKQIANGNLPLILFDNNSSLFYMKGIDGSFRKFKFEEIIDQEENATSRIDELENKLNTIINALNSKSNEQIVDTEQTVPNSQKTSQNTRKGVKQNG